MYKMLPMIISGWWWQDYRFLFSAYFPLFLNLTGTTYVIKVNNTHVICHCLSYFEQDLSCSFIIWQIHAKRFSTLQENPLKLDEKKNVAFYAFGYLISFVHGQNLNEMPLFLGIGFNGLVIFQYLQCTLHGVMV